MALASEHNKSDGVIKFASGARSGSRTAADFSIDLGFAPKYVKVTNLTDRVTGEWFAGEASGLDQTKELLTVAAGTRTYQSAGISVSGNTVTVTVATAGLETDNDDVVWEARG